MKKNNSPIRYLSILVILSIFGFSMLQVNAQTADQYSFSSSSGSYSSISGTDLDVIEADDALSTAIPIGFTFNYCGTDYTEVEVSSNGWLAFGTAASSSSATNDLDGSSMDRLAPLWDDLEGNSANPFRSAAEYETSGTAPNRTFTMQWQKWIWNYNAADDVISFQVILYEIDNHIEFRYDQETITPNSASASIGIQDAAGNFQSLDGTGASPSPSSVTETTTLSTRPASGQVYSWTPPSPCSGTPLAGTATPSPTSICASETSTITLTGYTTGPGISYQWQSATSIGGPYSDISGATSTSYVASPTVTTYYQCITTCSNSGLSNTSTIATVTLNAPSACYCASTFSNTTDDWITNVTFNTINNNTGQEGAGSYGDYTGISTNIQQLSSYTLSVSFSSGTYTEHVWAWIDWNQNGLFTDSGEAYDLGSGSSTTLTTNISVPLTAALGSTRMRVTERYSSDPTPCISSSYGETEDYTVNVVAAVGCSGTPTAGTASAGTSSFTCSGSTTITLSGYTVASGITFQWQSSPASAGTWSNIGGATNSTYTTPAISASTDYRCVVTCTNSSLSANSSTATVTINANIPGSAAASPATVCVGSSTGLSLTGTTISNSTYQWQSSPDDATWSDISGATSSTYTATPSTNTYYRCKITCTASATDTYSSSVLVSVTTPSYASVPYTQGFEGPWIDVCDTRDVPDIYWANTPKTGNQSWRRHDDGIAAAGWSSNSGLYSPVSSEGSYSAEFNAYSASSGTTGSLDLYIDMSPVGTKTIFFDYINPGTATANDKMEVLLSTDGGATFPTTLLSLTNVTNWTQQTFDIASTSPTCVIRFLATSDYGSSAENTGIDNLIVVLPCSGTPTAGTASSTNTTFCNSTIPELSLTGYTIAGGLNFQWQSSFTNAPYAWTNITGGNTPDFTAPSISQTTYYRCVVSCGANSAYSNIITISNTAEAITSTNTPVSITCGTAAVLNATASGGASINWYSSLTGGSLLGSGSSYTTATLTANSTFYCVAESGASTENGGMPAAVNTSGSLTNGSGIVFSANESFTLVSVTIYPSKNGTVDIAWQNSSGVEQASTGNVTVNGGPQANPVVVPLGWAIPPGSDYRLVLKANTVSDFLIYDSSTSYPYDSPSGALSVTSGWYTSGWTSSTNYYFYDLVISIACESTPRTPVDVVVTGVTPPVCSNYTSPADGASNICPINTLLEWSASLNPCQTATSYKLYFGTDAAATNIYNGVDIGNITSYDLGTISGNTTYYWKIVPTNSGGDASGCAIWSFTTAANPGTVCPTLLGTDVTSIASLPYSSGAGTTVGSVDDLNSGNIVSCGSNSYYDGEDAVWYFTPTLSGNVNIELTSSGSYTSLSIYEGCPLAVGSCGASPGSCLGYSQSSSGNESLSVCVVPGTTYYVIVDSWPSPANNPYDNLTISAPSGVSVPANDQPCNAEAISLGLITNGDNSCSGSAFEPTAPSCWSSGIENTVWYTVTAPASGELTVSATSVSLSDPQIALYEGSCGSLTQVSPTTSSCNNDMSGCGSTYNSLMSITGLTPGNTYYIVVDGAYDLTGTFTIEAIDPATQTLPVIPGQDCSIPLPTCAGIISVSDPGYANTGNICDFDGTNNCTSGERASVWYTIDIGANGTLQFDIIPNDYDGTVGSETDYDFLIWKTAGGGTTTDCAGIMADPGNALVACNFSYLGVTGLYPGGGGNPVFNAGTPWDAAYEDVITVTAGDQYVIVIQNYTQSTSGFTIDYTGTTPGVVNISATPTLIAWTGASNTAWGNSGNWGGCGIPSCATSAVIPSYMSTMPVISVNTSVNDLTINAGASLTINNNRTLTICGDFENSGDIIIGAGATLEFAGTTPQTVTNNNGTFTIPNVIINNTGGGVTLSGTTSSNMTVTGNFTLTNGILFTADPPMLIMEAGSDVVGGGATSFVDGPMQKVGGTPFIFPLGNNNVHARLGISPSSSSTFQGQYFNSGYPSTTLCAAPLPALGSVSSIEYWQLDRVAGTGNTPVTLYWENATNSGIASCAAPPAGDLCVARYTGTCWENKNTSGGSITGSCVGASAGTITSDLVTSFSPFTFATKSFPLPIELLTFTGKNANGENILNWTTASEINNDYFSLEKSSNGIDFKELAKINGAGNSYTVSEYNHPDKSPFRPGTYYRLKQVDFDGKYAYSNIILLRTEDFSKECELLDLFPNPASTKINCSFYTNFEAEIMVEIQDIAGRTISNENRFVQSGNDQVTFDISTLSNGVYYLKVTFTDTGKTSHKRFIKGLNK